ncbi:hypothetical protein B0H14DRAFT_2684349 [Mycena olivaceomarginata]|nr:hypothetical protein B0H14DRAFT_2684349 [Mycena olivaceomarginata]
MANLQLYMRVDGIWTMFLEIPVLEALRLATRPLKWLRYMGWCIHGQPGQLAATSDGSQVDEDPGLGGFLQCYYYVSSFPPRFIDVNAIDDRTSDASDLTQRRADFRDEVISRDGNCIITGDAPLNCMACHILPHAKGDSYMRSLMDFRGIVGPARVVEIGDVRNGILLCNGLHRPFGAGETPNLYLATDDIPTNFAGPQPPRRLTIQHVFTPPGVVTTARLAPHNDDAWLDVSPQAPSADILHFFYACAVLRRWGSTSGICLASKDIQDAQDVYYGDAPYIPDEDSGSETSEETSSNQGSTHDVMVGSNTRSSTLKPRGEVLAWLETIE